MRRQVVLKHGLTAAAAGLLLLVGCSREGTHSPYQVFVGTVKALDLETGELFVRAERAPSDWRIDRNIPCVVTKDSEVYISDQFSEIGEIVVGDSVTLVGFRDAGRFVVSFADVTRSQPEAPLPALSAPPTEPAAADPEE